MLRYWPGIPPQRGRSLVLMGFNFFGGIQPATWWRLGARTLPRRLASPRFLLEYAGWAFVAQFNLLHRDTLDRIQRVGYSTTCSGLPTRPTHPVRPTPSGRRRCLATIPGHHTCRFLRAFS
jgi:hypothetical protein